MAHWQEIYGLDFEPTDLSPWVTHAIGTPVGFNDKPIPVLGGPGPAGNGTLSGDVSYTFTAPSLGGWPLLAYSNHFIRVDQYSKVRFSGWIKPITLGNGGTKFTAQWFASSNAENLDYIRYDGGNSGVPAPLNVWTYATWELEVFPGVKWMDMRLGGYVYDGPPTAAGQTYRILIEDLKMEGYADVTVDPDIDTWNKGLPVNRNPDFALNVNDYGSYYGGMDPAYGSDLHVTSFDAVDNTAAWRSNNYGTAASLVPDHPGWLMEDNLTFEPGASPGSWIFHKVGAPSDLHNVAPTPTVDTTAPQGSQVGRVTFTYTSPSGNGVLLAYSNKNYATANKRRLKLSAWVKVNSVSAGNTGRNVGFQVALRNASSTDLVSYDMPVYVTTTVGQWHKIETEVDLNYYRGLHPTLTYFDVRLVLNPLETVAAGTTVTASVDDIRVETWAGQYDSGALKRVNTHPSGEGYSWRQTIAYNQAHSGPWLLADYYGGTGFWAARPGGTTKIHARARVRWTNATAGSPTKAFASIYRFDNNVGTTTIARKELTLSGPWVTVQATIDVASLPSGSSGNHKMWVVIDYDGQTAPKNSIMSFEVAEVTSRPWNGTTTVYPGPYGPTAWRATPRYPGATRGGAGELLFTLETAALRTIFQDANETPLIDVTKRWFGEAWVRVVSEYPMHIQLSARGFKSDGSYAAGHGFESKLIKPSDGWVRLTGTLPYRKLLAGTKRVGAELAFYGQDFNVPGDYHRLQIGKLASYYAPEYQPTKMLMVGNGATGETKAYTVPSSPTAPEVSAIREAVRGNTKYSTA